MPFRVAHAGMTGNRCRRLRLRSQFANKYRRGKLCSCLSETVQFQKIVFDQLKTHCQINLSQRKGKKRKVGWSLTRVDVSVCFRNHSESEAVLALSSRHITSSSRRRMMCASHPYGCKRTPQILSGAGSLSQTCIATTHSLLRFYPYVYVSWTLGFWPASCDNTSP